MGNGTTAQLGTSIEQTLDDNNGTAVVQQSKLGEIVPQKLDIPIDGSEEIPGYIDQIVQNFGNRIEEQKDISGDWWRGEMDLNTGRGIFDKAAGFAIHNVQSIGKTGAGTLMDLIGVGIGAAFDGISWVVPDSIEDPIKQQVADSWDWMMNTEAGQDAAEAFAGGVGKYKTWKEENPQAARTFEGLVNVGIMFTPLKGRVKAAPVEGKVLSNLSTKYSKLAGKQETRERFIAIEKLLAPKITKDNITAKGVGGESLLAESTFFKQAALKSGASEKEVIEYLSSLTIKNKKGQTVPLIDTTKGASDALAKIINLNAKLDDEIGKILIQHKDLIIQPKSISMRIQNNLGQALEKIPTLKSNAQILKTVEDYVSAAKAILKKHPNTPQGVHKARIEFDQFMKNEVSKKVLSVEATGLNSIVAKEIRNAMNSSIDDVLPKGFNSVSTRRHSQHLNYRALESLAPKAAADVAAGMTTTFQNLMKFSRSRNALVGTFGLLAGYQYSPQALLWTIGGASALAATTWGARFITRASMSSKNKRNLSKFISHIDRGIKETRNSEMRKSLKLNRVLMSDLLQLPTENVDAAGNPL